MSRWIDQFKAHPYQSTWSNLKESLENSKIDDESVLTSVKELARLKKVIQYLDEMLKGLDPELVPPSTWDNFNNQAAPCLQHINTFNSNRNISHITQANLHADNLLTYVRPYEVAHGKSVNAMQAALKNYAKTIDEYAEAFRKKATAIVADVGKYRNSAKETLDVIDGVKKIVDQFNVELFGEDDVTGVQLKIRTLSEDLDAKHEKITEYYNEILIGDEQNVSIKKETLQAKELILQEQDKIQDLLESVSKEVSELENFHTKIFGKEGEDKKRVGGLSSDLDNLIRALKEFEIEQKDKYKALNDEINSLLPGATSAGLATAYKDMKISFDNPIKHSSRVFYWSIGLLVVASILLAVDTIGGASWVTFVKFQDWGVVLKELVYKIPFYAPVLWLAFYATKRRSEYQRLQQEYAHKEALAKSYNSYKKQIEDLDVKDLAMQKDFITKTIDAIAYNASATLDGKHGDKMPAQELIEKLVTELAKIQTISGKP